MRLSNDVKLESLRLELNIHLSFEQIEQSIITVFKMTVLLPAAQYFACFVKN